MKNIAYLIFLLSNFGLVAISVGVIVLPLNNITGYILFVLSLLCMVGNMYSTGVSK